MKKYKRYLCIAAAVMMLFLTGCGTELYELTEEEETLIVQSAAYLLAKHNIQQKDGVNGYPLPDSFEEDESESESETGTENDGSGSGGETEDVKPPSDMVTLAELIGHKDSLKITYEGSYIANSYKEGDAYIVDAAAGKTFYVMKFKLTNEKMGVCFSYSREEKIWITLLQNQQKICIRELELVQLLKELL